MMNSFKFIFSGGTFHGNPLTMKAGAAIIGYLKAHPGICLRLTEQSDRLAKKLEEEGKINLSGA